MSLYQVFVNGEFKDEYAVESNAQAHVETAQRLGNKAHYQPAEDAPKRPLLSQTQLKVLCMLGHGHVTEPGPGAIITIKGHKVCFISTMIALRDKGLAELVVLNGESQRGCWRATDAGKILAKQLSN